MPDHAPTLSHATSLSDLPIGSLTITPAADPVHLGDAQAHALVAHLLASADNAADRTAERARHRHGGDPVAALHHILTRKQFHRGSRALYPPSAAERDIRPAVTAAEPVPVVLVGFPRKQSQSRLKAAGDLPDLAELGTLIRLRELHRAARAVHPPGLRITVLTDGTHFRPHPPTAVRPYHATLAGYRTLAGLDGILDLVDIDTAATDRLGPDLPARRTAAVVRHRRALRAVLCALPDVGTDPHAALSALTTAHHRPAHHIPSMRNPDTPPPRRPPDLPALFRSLLHSIPVPPPPGTAQLPWSQAVLADPLTLTDPAVPAPVRAARRDLLRRTWHDMVEYTAAWHADRDLGYDALFPPHVRLTMSVPLPGRCGFIPLGGSGVMPWHGTAAVDTTGALATDFAIALLDRGFVPVHTPLLGPHQPFFMAPATAVTPEGTLHPDLTTAIHLRRR